MSIFPSPLRHQAFFEALAQLREADPDWHALSAGLLILRVIDRLDDDGLYRNSRTLRLAAIEKAVASVPQNHPHRRILENLFDSLAGALDPVLPGVNGRLAAYSHILQSEGRWGVAVDVYRTLVARTAPDDSDLAIASYLGMGSCLRTLGRHDDALEAYEAAAMLAEEYGRMGDRTRAMIGQGNVALQRGNLPEAERLLEEAIVRARAFGDRAVEAAARHDLGHVAYRLTDYPRAARLFYGAFQTYTEEHRRDRALADLATTLAELGHLAAARDAHLIVSVTGQEQYLRWLAQINLMEIAMLEGSETLFEEHRRPLRNAPLPPELATHYHLGVARGHRRFHRPSQADAAYGRAIALAEANEFGQLLHIAEQERAAPAGGSPAKRRAPEPEVSDIVHAVHELRLRAVPA